MVWLEELEGTARELLATAEASEDGKPTKIEQAKLLLQSLLAKGEQKQPDIMAAAKAEGISEKTLRRAKDELHIGQRRERRLAMVPVTKSWLLGHLALATLPYTLKFLLLLEDGQDGQDLVTGV